MLLVSPDTRLVFCFILYLGECVHCGKVGGNPKREGVEMEKLGFVAGKVSGWELDIRRIRNNGAGMGIGRGNVGDG